jgi:hypothetical protein
MMYVVSHGTSKAKMREPPGNIDFAESPAFTFQIGEN